MTYLYIKCCRKSTPSIFKGLKLGGSWFKFLLPCEFWSPCLLVALDLESGCLYYYALSRFFQRVNWRRKNRPSSVPSKALIDLRGIYQSKMDWSITALSPSRFTKGFAKYFHGDCKGTATGASESHWTFWVIEMYSSAAMN